MLVACLSHPSDLMVLASNPVPVYALTLPEQPELPIAPRLHSLCISFPNLGNSQLYDPVIALHTHILSTTHLTLICFPTQINHLLKSPSHPLHLSFWLTLNPCLHTHPNPMSSYITPVHSAQPLVHIHTPPIRNFSSLLLIHSIPTRMVH